MIKRLKAKFGLTWLVLLALLTIAAVVYAATGTGSTEFSGVIVDPSAIPAGDRPTYGIRNNNASSTRTFSVTPAGVVYTALGVTSPIAHRIPVPLASVFVDGTGPITNATAPNLTTLDNVGAILYDDSTEVAEIQFPWYPHTNFSAMSVGLMVSSNDASGAANAVDWGIFVQDDATTFGTVVAQTGVSCTSATLDVSNELLTLTLDATGIAAVTAGSSAVTIAIWNNSSNDDDLEIKAIWIEETRGE